MSGKREVVQSLALPRSDNTRRSLHWLSKRTFFVIDHNAGEKDLILQTSSPAVSDTLFDSSQAQRLQNQSVDAEGVQTVPRPPLH